MAFWQMVAACVMRFVICQIQRKPIPMTRQALPLSAMSVLASSVPQPSYVCSRAGAGWGGRHYHRNCADADLCAGNQYGT